MGNPFPHQFVDGLYEMRQNSTKITASENSDSDTPFLLRGNYSEIHPIPNPSQGPTQQHINHPSELWAPWAVGLGGAVAVVDLGADAAEAVPAPPALRRARPARRPHRPAEAAGREGSCSDHRVENRTVPPPFPL